MSVPLHPEYIACHQDWEKWRLVYEGGDDFISRYLKKFSRRESNADFVQRKQITPNPSFAAAAVNDIKNSIFQRMVDITREGGSPTYQAAVKGSLGGVDLCGSTMNYFIGHCILPELLTMGKVGIFIDMPPIPPGASLADTMNMHPYLYYYRVEDILSWTPCNFGQPGQFKSVLLRHWVIEYDEATGLANGRRQVLRRLWVDSETGLVNEERNWGEEGSTIITTSLREIPFIVLDIKKSLLADVANHQIALLNLVSSDIAYALKANFPFYVEQQDLRAGSHHLIETLTPDAAAVEGSQQGRDREIVVGAVQGRIYPLNTERPSFINPSSEPLEASMKLQEKLEKDIRLLVNLAVTNLGLAASAESKEMDRVGLEAGLSYIGLVLENGERQIARHWAAYENSEPATIRYPERYSLKSDKDRRDEAKDHDRLKFSVPSVTFQKRINKDIVNILLGGKISIEELNRIYAEIDAANYQTSDPDIIEKDIDKGLVSMETAAKARGYNADEIEQARMDQAIRLRLIQEAQQAISEKPGGARGVQDFSVLPNEAEIEKIGKRRRGPAKDQPDEGEGA